MISEEARNLSVIITGASSGIGRQVAIDLASAGVKLLAIARREDLLKQVRETDKSHIDILSIDITCPENDSKILKWALSASGVLGLINCAGIGEFGDFAELPFESFEKQIAVNLLAPARLIHLLLPELIKRKGQIVNVLSVVCETIIPDSEAYSASKSGLQMLSKVLSQSHRKQGLRVSCVIPGAVDTPMWAGKAFIPKKEDMLTPEAVSRIVCDVVLSPPDRNFDEILLTPPVGIS